MTAINLPGQRELPIVVDHKRCSILRETNVRYSAHTETIVPRDVQIAKLLRDYDQRPSSETWSRIQALAAEILK
jgi:hypothetical protein